MSNRADKKQEGAASDDLRILQVAIDAIDVGIIFLDRELRIARYMPRAQDLFNIASTDIGRPLSQVTHKLDCASLIEDAKQALASASQVEREVETTDGRWFLIRLTAYRGSDGSAQGVVLTFVEITERKQTELALRGSEERLRLLIESVRDYAILTMDLEGRITRWNVGAEKIFGFTEQEACGKFTDFIFTPEDRARGVPQEEIRKALAEGRAEDERWHVRKDGSRFYASGVMTPLRDGQPVGLVKILRDLTERERMEEELRRSRDDLDRRIKERTRELEQSNESVKDLMRRVVSTQEIERHRISRDLHDQLGQQLTALRLSLESFASQDRYRDSSGDIKRLQAIAQQIEKDLDFLTWELRPAALEHVGLVAALDNFVQEWSKHFGITARFHTSGFNHKRLTPETEINIYRTVQEALNNIVKHAEATRADVILERRAGDAVLIVEDDGKGFSPEQQLSPTGRGIGIVSMRERASLIGGTLEIETAPGKGTTVFMRIPARFAGEGHE